jgi:pyruvate dehydrogenase E2 component (dihydrolipoamide acetyltransferase)
VDLNIVVGGGDSLSTPVLRSCATKGLKQISNEIKDLLSRIATEGSGDTVSEVGTFTVLNLGMYGIKSCASIIHEPQSCALAIGALEKRIVPNDDPDSEDIYKECVMFTATLSCDHRVVDGAVGAQWLAAFKSHVENPTTLLL